MDLPGTLLQLVQDPDSRRVLFGLAVFLLLIAWLLRRVSRRWGVGQRNIHIGGDNTGIAVNGSVGGDITQMRTSSHGEFAGDKGSEKGTTVRLLEILSQLSGIAGLVVAAAAFYLEYMQ